MTLYELTGHWSLLASALEAVTTDEAREPIIEEMEMCGGDIAEKAEAYARIIRNAEAEAEALDTEIKRLTAIKKQRESLCDRLKHNLENTMITMGEDKIKTSIGTWKRTQCPLSVNVINVDAVPERFHVHQPDTIDKRSILAEFKETGEMFDGVEMVRNEKLNLK